MATLISSKGTLGLKGLVLSLFTHITCPTLHAEHTPTALGSLQMEAGDPKGQPAPPGHDG